MIDFLNSLDWSQCVALIVIAFICSTYFAWKSHLDREQLKRERERRRKDRAYKTFSSCQKDTQKILFQLCTSCFVESMDRFDQIVDYEQEIETKVKKAIIMPEED